MVSYPTKEVLLEIYEDKWHSRGFDNRKHEQTRKDFGRRKLEEFYELFYSREDIPIEIEKRFNYKIDGVSVNGYIDRIDLVEDAKKPRVRIIDYKTGKLKEKKEVEKDLQLALYSMVVEEAFEMEVVEAGLLFIEHGELVTTKLTEELKSETKSKLKAIIDKIREGDFDPTPGFVCKFCDYSDICEDSYY
jgi:CRISPR/Cas system-associated exonuclease Cas4 (RecB family)